MVSTSRWRVADNITKKTLILSGVGWGNLPIWMIDRELRDGDLVRLPVAAFAEGSESTVQTYLAYRVDRPLGPVGGAFREALLANLPQDARRS